MRLPAIGMRITGRALSGIVTNSGGPATLCVDALIEHGFKIEPLPDDLRKRLYRYLDKHFYERALKEGKSVQGLETPDYQISRFDELSIEQQDHLLATSLHDLDAELAAVTRLADAWRAGDAATVERIALQALKEDPLMYQRLLVERVKSVLRRTAPKDTAVPKEPDIKALERGQLRMDPERHTCTWKGENVTLTVTEFLILYALAQRPGVVKSRNSLMDAAYDDQVYVDDRTIDSHIKRLRKKFKVVDTDFNMIETLYGVGYRFREI